MNRMATMIIGKSGPGSFGPHVRGPHPATGEVVDGCPRGGRKTSTRRAGRGQGIHDLVENSNTSEPRSCTSGHHMLGKVEEIAPILTKEQGKDAHWSHGSRPALRREHRRFADLTDKIHGEHVSLPDTTNVRPVVRRPIGNQRRRRAWNFRSPWLRTRSHRRSRQATPSSSAASTTPLSTSHA